MTIGKLAFSMAVALLLSSALLANTEDTVVCERTGESVDASRAVVVTDWVRNEKHTFHDLPCAVAAMSADYPWSQARFESSTGKTLRISNADGTWSSEPEAATVAIVEQESGAPKVLAFNSYQDLSVYSRKHNDLSVSLLRTVPLSRLPDDTALLNAAYEPTLVLALKETEENGQSEKAVNSPPVLPLDVPPDHWAAEPVRKAGSRGLMKGYPDGTFQGKKAVSRYEMAVILDRLSEEHPLEEVIATALPAAATEPTEETGAGEQPDGPLTKTAYEPTSNSGERRGYAGSPRAGRDEPEYASDVNFFAQPGLLLAPTAGAVGKNTFVAGRAQLTDSSLTYGSVGLGEDGRYQAGFAVTGGHLPSKVLLNGRYRLSSGPWGSSVAVGILDVTDQIDSSAYGVLSKTFSTSFLGDSHDIEVSGGYGSGDLLRGPFIGARATLGNRGSLLTEYVQSFKGRSVNVGLGYRLVDDLNLKVGFVDDELGGSLSVGGSF